MQYALLIYGSQRTTETAGPMDPEVATVLERPAVTGWSRLHAAGSATTVCDGGLFIDGPFVETKEHLAGLIMVEADNLDGALAIARELQVTKPGGGIEVRPVFESSFRGP